MEPQAGQVITVFRSRLRQVSTAAYHAHATRMSELAATMSGYVEHKGFVAEDGERVTLVTFADHASHEAWRVHREHRDAQRVGIADYYAAYSIAVGTVSYASAFIRADEKLAMTSAQVHVSEPDVQSGSSIGVELARDCVDGYIQAWNEPAADRRIQMLAQVMTEDGAYADPDARVDSRAGLAGYIGEVLGRYPGGRIVRTSEVDAHNLACRFTWRLVKADGTQASESIDFVEFVEDGRIRRVTGFFGALTGGGLRHR